MTKQSVINHFMAAALFMLGSPALINAQIVKNERMFSFEDKKAPSVFSCTHSKLSISDLHFKDGSRSLEWNFKPSAVLSLKKDLLFEKKDPTGKDLYLSAFIVWVYNEKAEDKTIEFEFLKDGRKCVSFPFGINFTGWRAAWVCYERDMKGTPEEGMNELRVVAPNVKGKLFFDHLITSVKVDARQQTADLQVPFVNANTTNHWLVIYPHSLLKPDIALTPVSEQQKKEMKLIEKRFREMIYTPGKLSDKAVENIREKYNFYHITYKKGKKVSGTSIFMVRAAEAYERMIPDWDKDMFTKMGVEIRAYLDLMKQIAVAYHNSKDASVKDEMRQKFLAMYDHITDQGVVYGSCWGNIHHYGYSIRSLYPAYFLMKDVLAEEGKLLEAEKTLNWYAITNEVYPMPLVDGIDMDSFNTQTIGRIASILIMQDTPEKLQLLRSFSRWIDRGCRPAQGLMGAFKSDGASFHHCNNYPAYAVGGLDGATNMIYLLSRTEFAVSPLAHETVKKALLTMRFYCNKLSFPISMSGRHPNGKGKLIPIQYGRMAISGTSDRIQEFDTEMARAYLRLVSGPILKKNDPEYMPQVSNDEEQNMAKQLLAKGFVAEADPQGNIALGYGCVSVQRRSNWAAVVRGHSRYFWAAEHYEGANLYGRYLAHGSMQILTAQPGQTVTPLTGGWQQDGFDWNRVPGVTSIHLPYDQLRAHILNVDTCSGVEEMLYSDEAFAGGLSQLQTNGNFGMKLHEHDKYNGSLRARKSFHFFGGTIVCLGSDIENTNKDFNTETTVFQVTMANKEQRDFWRSNDSGVKGLYLDHLGNGYYLPSSQNAHLDVCEKQCSPLQNSDRMTCGAWASLVIDHGKAPHAGSYEYAVVPQTSMQSMKAFAQKPTYMVIQKDRNAHIVKSLAEQITSYVLFEKPETTLPGELLQKADTSCLVMIRRSAVDKAILTVAQPDLALYRGASDEAFDKNGKRIERSIYSRPWKTNASGVIPVTLTLSGCWKVKENPSCEVLSSNINQTVIRFSCKDAASYSVELYRTK